MKNRISDNLSPNIRPILTLLAGGVLLVAPGCHQTVKTDEPNRSSKLTAPFTSGQACVDGKLDEPCYQTPPLVEDFVLASQTGRQPPKTRAWLFWQRDKLIFAFDCEDADLVAAPPSANKHDVDAQDRVELFLWSGRTEDTYYCIEIGGRGAVARLCGPILSPLR